MSHKTRFTAHVPETPPVIRVRPLTEEEALARAEKHHKRFLRMLEHDKANGTGWYEDEVPDE